MKNMSRLVPYSGIFYWLQSEVKCKLGFQTPVFSSHKVAVMSTLIRDTEV